MNLVYLAGPIAGQTFQLANAWRERAADLLSPLRSLSPTRCKEFLRSQGILNGDAYDHRQGRGPSDPHPLGSSAGIVTRDRYDIFRSDIILMNLLPAQETDQISIGTMVELGWADAYRKPVVLVWNRNINPHAHCFLDELCSYQADNLEDAVDLCKMIIL